MSPAANVMDPLRAGPTSSTSLIKALQLPQPTLSRALSALQREGLGKHPTASASAGIDKPCVEQRKVDGQMKNYIKVNRRWNLEEIYV
jgi:predicted transcriptional regulator